MKIKKHTYIVKSLIITLMIILYGISAKAQTSTVYPADINVTLTPPYGTCLTDLAGSDRFRIQVLLRDMTHPNYEMVVQMRLRSLASQQTVFVSRTNKFSVNAGKPVVLIGKEGMSDVSISQFFDTKNVKNGRNFCTDNCLPEGAYIFSFQLYDYQSYERNNPIPVSREVTFTAFLEGGATPILIAPANNDSICNVNSIHFSWMQPYVTSGINTYRLQVVEAKNGVLSPDMFNDDNNLLLNKNWLLPNYTWEITTGSLQENTTYGWRVVMCDANGDPRKSYPNGGASEVRRFVYCGEKQDPVPDPDAGWVQQVPKAKTINDKLDIVRLDTVKMDAASSASAFCQKDPQEIRDKYSGIIVEVKKVSHDLWSPFTLESTDQLDTVIALGQLAYGEEYHARAQYFAYDGEKIKYAPYSDTVTFSLRHPADTIECGGELPKLTSTETDKNSTLQKGDVFTANGRSVTILELTEANTGELSGTGYINFPILSNFKLKVQFENLKLNAEKELVSGEITSVYDKSTAATIDLNNTIGRGAGGYDMSEKAPNIDDVPSGIHGSVYSDNSNSIMLDTEEGPINIASPIDLSTSGAYEDNDHRTDHQLVRFSNPDPQNIAFDDDGENLYRKASRLSGHYEKFAPDYIIPWVATNPGRTFSLTATPDKEEFKYTDLRFVLKTTSGHIELNTEKNNDGTTYSVTIPGTKADNVTHVYAIARPADGQPFENVGRLKVACYEKRTQKVVLVPLANNLTIDQTAVEKFLNSVYGKLGYTFSVQYDNDKSHTEGLENITSLNIGSGLLTQYSAEMKNVADTYIANISKSGDNIDKDAAYLFLMNSASEGKVAGIMPQKHPFGFIFMNGKTGNDDEMNRTIAHELGHGLWGLDHVFDRAYGIQQGTTTNLMDYTDRTPSTYLAHFQWNLISKPSYNWSLFTGDEGNEYKPWTFADTFIVENLKDPSNKTGKYTFAVTDKEKIVVPAGTKRLTFNKKGYLVAFVDENNELWHSFWATGDNPTFLGFYKDLKVSKIDANGERIYSRNNENKNYSFKPEDVEKDSVYMPIFEGEQCYVTTLYKVPTPQNTDISYLELYKKIKGMTEDERVEKDYCRIAYYYEFDFSHCLPESVRTLYLFMTNYYDYFTSASDDELDFRKQELKILLQRFNSVKIHGLDNTENCFIESDLSSQKGFDVETFIKDIEKKYNDKLKSEEYQSDLYEEEAKRKYSKLNLCITFDNYSVYQDFYLKQFSPVEKGEPKCTQKQWESDLTYLDRYYNAVKNNEDLKDDKGKVIKQKPNIYDFCGYIVGMCHDYLHTIRYEKIQDYLRLIVDHCSGKYEGSFSLDIFIHRFDERAEKASLWLMTAIDKSDYGKFAKYLAENNNGVLFGYMKKFDDVHVKAIFPCDNNNFTRFMRVLATMFRANPEAFIDTDPTHYNYKQCIAIKKDFDFDYSYEESTGLCHLKIESNNGEIIYNGDNLSPFQQVYFLIDKENAPQKELVGDFSEFDLDIEKYKELGIEREADVFLLSCPLIFLQYYEDKDNVETGENFACAAGIVVGVAALAVLVGPQLVAYIAANGASKALSWVAARYGQKALANFITGAVVDGTVYMIGQEISVVLFDSNDEIIPLDLLYHMIIGGLNNVFENRYAKWGLACVQATDFTAMYDCVVNGSSNCGKKLFFECATSTVFEIVFSSTKLKEAITGKYKSYMLGRLIKKYKDVPQEYVLKVFASMNGLRKTFADEVIQLSKKHGSKGFEVLCDANFDFKYLRTKTLKKVFEAMEKDGSEACYNSMKEALLKNNKSVAELLTMLDKVQQTKTFAKKLNEIWEKAEKLTVQELDGKKVKFSDILNDPFKYDANMKVLTKYVKENNCVLYRYVVMGKIIEVQVNAGASLLSTVIVKFVDWANKDDAPSNEKGKSIEEMINNDGFEIVDVYEEE